MAKWKRKVLVRIVRTSSRSSRSPLLKISDNRIFMINIPTVMTDLKLREIYYVGNFLDFKKEKINCGQITSAEISVADRKLSVKAGSVEYVFEIIDRLKESEKYYKTFSYFPENFPESVPKYSEKDIANVHKLFDDTERKMSYANADIFSNNSYPGTKYLDDNSTNTSKSSKRRRNRHYSKHKPNTEIK